MLHELLFHLLDGKSKLTSLDLLAMEDFIHQGDIEILDQIITIGLDYRLLQTSHRQMTSRCCVYTENDENHINTELIALDSSFSEIRPGLYLTAFCNGLDYVLQSYRDEIDRLEEVMMVNPQLSLSYVLSRTMKFVPLFALLKSMLQLIKLEKVHGCLLVGWLHLYNNYGIEYIVETAKKIQTAVNVVFYKQLANWLIYGDLVDEYGEFFIEQAPDPLIDSATNNTSSTATLTHQGGSINSVLGLDGTNKTLTVDSGQCSLQSSGRGAAGRSNIAKEGRDSMKRFRLKLENLPEVIPFDLAKDILFTGQMVWIVKERDSSIDVWQNQSLDLISRIQHLPTTFHQHHFTATVTHCKSLISQYLWSIITPTPGPTATISTSSQSLHHHMRLIRDYYCLGRGELFQQYVTAAVRDVTEAGGKQLQQQQQQLEGGGGGDRSIALDRWNSRRLDALFHETARRLYGDGDRSHERFKMGLGDGEMHFEASWPLDVLVFTASTHQQYTRIFQFLLRIQRTQSNLHQLWWTQHRRSLNTMMLKPPASRSSTSSIAGSETPSTSIGGSCWSLRHNLQFVVDNLQYYLHVDVIEAEFARFERWLDKTSSAGDVTSLHSRFLGDLLSRTFVMGSLTSSSTDQNNVSAAPLGKNDRMVYNIICHLLDLCDEFCSAVAVFDGPLDTHMLEPFQDRFRTMMEMLLRILYSLHKKVSSGYHVLQLLLRLDFNRWYTQTLSASDLNLTKLRI